MSAKLTVEGWAANRVLELEADLAAARRENLSAVSLNAQLLDVLGIAEALEADLAAARRENATLRAGIEDYLLWEPCRKGHAEAHRRLAALAASPAAEEPQP